MSGDGKLPSKSSSADVDAFLRKVAAAPSIPGTGERGRLIFAMDATASRQPTWDRASHIQGEMINDSARLLNSMTSVFCLAGHTQIGKVLKHAMKETKKRKVAALVFVGDCLEEDIDNLGQLAGELGLLAVPCFMFHEGGDPVARNAFQQIARLSGGAFCPFDANSPQQLRDLLAAVAVYAAGGRRALTDYSQRKGGVVRKLTHQVK